MAIFSLHASTSPAAATVFLYGVRVGDAGGNSFCSLG